VCKELGHVTTDDADNSVHHEGVVVVSLGGPALAVVDSHSMIVSRCSFRLHQKQFQFASDDLISHTCVFSFELGYK